MQFTWFGSTKATLRPVYPYSRPLHPIFTAQHVDIRSLVEKDDFLFFVKNKVEKGMLRWIAFKSSTYWLIVDDFSPSNEGNICSSKAAVFIKKMYWTSIFPLIEVNKNIKFNEAIGRRTNFCHCHLFFCR